MYYGFGGWPLSKATGALSKVPAASGWIAPGGGFGKPGVGLPFGGGLGGFAVPGFAVAEGGAAGPGWACGETGCI